MGNSLLQIDTYRKVPSTITYTIAVLSFYLTACQGQKKDSSSEAPAEYEILEISPRQTTIYNRFPVSIQGQQQVEIRPMVDGYIEKIFVDEGATVKAGQPLFRIKAPQYEQEVRSADAEINIAMENVTIAQMDVEKVRPLVEDNIISSYELKTAQNILNSKNASLAQARARMANARTNLGYTTVNSPINGVIGMLPFKLGSLVGPTMSEPLTHIANIGNAYAYFSLNEKQLLALALDHPGKNIQDVLKKLPLVKLLLADGSTFPVQGKIETASGLLDKQTGSVNIRATFQNAGHIINSGSSGTLLIPEHIEQAILIPQSATYEIQDKKFTYVANSSGIVNSKEISVKMTDDGRYYIVEKGLKNGDMIVIGGIATLKDQKQIKIKKISADTLFKK